MTSLADVLLLPVNPAARLRAWVTVLVGVALLPVRAASSARMAVRKAVALWSYSCLRVWQEAGILSSRHWAVYY